MIKKSTYYNKYNLSLSKEVVKILYPILLSQECRILLYRNPIKLSKKNYPDIIIDSEGVIKSKALDIRINNGHERHNSAFWWNCPLKYIGELKHNTCSVYNYFLSNKLDFQYKNYVADLYFQVLRLNYSLYKANCFKVSDAFQDENHTINSVLYKLHKFPILKTRKVITEKFETMNKYDYYK